MPHVHVFEHIIQNGATALCVAAMKGHLSVVELLLEANANTNIKDNVSLRVVAYYTLGIDMLHVYLSEPKNGSALGQ